MTTQDILNEREKTHGDFKTASETHYKAKELFREQMQKNDVPLYRIEAIEAIIAKINRIAHGNHDHADHWDDIAGYALLGRGKEAKIRQEDMPHTAKAGQKFKYEGGEFVPLEEWAYCKECDGNAQHEDGFCLRESCWEEEVPATTSSKNYRCRNCGNFKPAKDMCVIAEDISFYVCIDCAPEVKERMPKAKPSTDKENLTVGKKSNCCYTVPGTEEFVMCEEHKEEGARKFSGAIIVDDPRNAENSTSSKMEHVGDEWYDSEKLSPASDELVDAILKIDGGEEIKNKEIRARFIHGKWDIVRYNDLVYRDLELVKKLCDKNPKVVKWKYAD